MEMPEILLYRADGACSWVPHALLRHLDIPFEDFRMEFLPNDGGTLGVNGTISREEYIRTVNPDGYVPVLVVGDEKVTEQLAVLNMIVSLAPDQEKAQAMLGRTALERVRVIQWMAWLSDTLHSKAFGAAVHPKRYVEDHTEMYGVVVAKGIKTIHESFGRIDRHMEDRQFMVGHALTVVDLFVYLVWGWAKFMATNVGATEDMYPAYVQHLRGLESTDIVKKTSKAENRDLYFQQSPKSKD
ncbi:glutathione S-transferase [Xylariaceae sp. FL1272]|nr:glutathione S-transferase [Xylariaceae sp. FL1272]